jgi:hypothetical protein
MTEEAIAHLRELAGLLRSDLEQIQKSAEVGPRACRRTVRQYSQVITRTLASMDEALDTGEIKFMAGCGHN